MKWLKVFNADYYGSQTCYLVKLVCGMVCHGIFLAKRNIPITHPIFHAFWKLNIIFFCPKKVGVDTWSFFYKRWLWWLRCRVYMLNLSSKPASCAIVWLIILKRLSTPKAKPTPTRLCVQIDDDNEAKNVQLNDKHVYLFNFVRTITQTTTKS